MKSYQEINKDTIDKWVEEGWEWGKPVSHEEYINAKNGSWNVLLTPTVFVPHEWFGSLKGKKILGLASGGGQQMPIFNALGAECTVLDYSSKQIKSELLIAEREGYDINAVEGDMTKNFLLQMKVLILYSTRFQIVMLKMYSMFLMKLTGF